MGSYMFFCLQYVLISFEDVRFIWEPQGDIQCTYKCSGVRTHQISVQALIPLFVRFCVVTFGKLFCSEWIKNAKCVSVCLCRVSIPLLINHISDLSFDLFLSLVVLVLLFFLNTLICWHSVPLFFFPFWLNIVDVQDCQHETPGKIKQRHQVLSAFIAEGNVAALHWRHFFFFHLPCLWLDRLYGRS